MDEEDRTDDETSLKNNDILDKEDKRAAVKSGLEDISSLDEEDQQFMNDIVSRIQAGDDVEVDVRNRDGWTALILATQNCHTETVTCLIEAKASLDIQTQDGMTALMLAAENGHTEIGKCLIVAKASLDIQNQHGWTALMLASKTGNTEIVTFLVKAKASLDIQAQDGSTALILASQNGHTEIVLCLIEAKASLDIQTQHGWTALMLASENGHTDIVTFFVKAKASLDIQAQHGWTALMLASENKHTEIVTFLIEAKASLDIQTQHGWTALMLASQDGHTEIVTRLIEAKASLNIQTQSGSTALMLASQNDQTYIVTCLIQAKASLDIKSQGGSTALMLASQNGHTEIVTCLIEAKASLDIQIQGGWTALMFASKNGDTEIATFLVQAKASLNIQAKDGSTALILASEDGHTEIVTCLIEAKASLDIQIQDGRTALILASQNDHTEIVTCLIEAKASLDIQTPNGSTALILASEDGHTDIVTCLIEAKASLDIQSQHGWTALMLASQNGYTEIVTRLIEAKASLDIQTQHGWTALIRASLYGHTEIATYLIEAKASLDIQTQHGWTALMLASENGHTEIATFLTQAKASLDIQAQDGSTALMLATHNGHTKIVTCLIEAKASLDIQIQDGGTALMLAAMNGHKEIGKCLIVAKASLDIQNQDGWTALMLAYQNGHMEIVTCLIEAKASLDIQTQDGWTALMLAYQNGHMEIVTCLIEAKASLDIQTQNGSTALILAAAMNGHTEIVKCLIEAKASLDIQNQHGWTALILASQDGHTEIATRLIEAKASLDIQTQDGSTALILASQDGHTEIAVCLIEANASLDIQTQQRSTALMLASQNGHAEIVTSLIEAKASLDIQTRDGWTALTLATQNGHTEIVTCLIEAKASLDIQNQDGWTALLLATQNGLSEIVVCLIEAKASLDIQNQNGQTALHQTCDTLHPNIRQIVLLIEAGANLEIVDKGGKTPLACLQMKRDDDNYHPIKKALERREYSQLLSTDAIPLKVVKLFLLGHPKAGKTTLKKALIKKKGVIEYIPTPGIDIGTHEVDSVGPLCIWDTAGQIEFHITHSLFLGSENAMAVVVYDLRGGYQDESTKLKYWFKFITSGLSAIQKGRFKVVVVGTHLDHIQDTRRAKAVWEQIVTNIVREFGDILDIEAEPISVNGCVHDSKEMKSLRECIGKAAENIKGSKRIPLLCEEILKRREQWIASLRRTDPIYENLNFFKQREQHGPSVRSSETPKDTIGPDRQLMTPKRIIQTKTCPVIAYREFETLVREIDPLASTDIIRIAGNFLQDMGEIFLANFANEETYVVLNTQWLCFEIIGRTFAGDEFKGRLVKLPDKPFFSTEELERCYVNNADFSTLALLLSSLDLMVNFAPDQFIIFAKLEPGNPLNLPMMKHMFGVCIFCKDKRTMFTPGLYPAVQARIMKKIKVQANRLPSITQQALKFVKKEEGLIELSSSREIIKYVVGTNDDNLEKCHQDLEAVSAIIETALLEVSCGTKIKKGYLSHRELLMPDVSLEDVSYYTQEEVEAAEDTDGFVYQRSKNTKENVSEILVAGCDTTFIRKLGIRCDMKWMLKDQKEEFLSEMNNDDRYLRQDYRSLAEVIGISNNKVQRIVRRCRDHPELVTDSIIHEWCEMTGEKLTFQMMLTMLHNPGLVGNEAAARIIEKNLADCGHKGPYPFCSLESKIDETLVVWRAVLRKTYDVIVSNIRPSKLTGLSQILTPRELEEINVKEQRKGRSVEATNILIGKLMALQNTSWPEMFLASLERYYSPLAMELTRVHECLKDDIFAPVAIKIDLDSAGFKTTFIRTFGIKCDIKWMLKDQKEEFLSEMNNDERSLRQDYRSLAEVIGISNNKVQRIVRRCRDHPELVTDSIIHEWCEMTGEKLTFQMILTMLHHPGLIANEAAARIIEKNLADCGHKGPYPSCNLEIKIDETVVVWRAVLRKTYDVIVSNIRPSKLTGLSQILTPKEQEEIYVKEKREGRSVKATDILIGNLMALQNPRWPEIFLASLEKYYSPLAKELTRVQLCLKDDIFARIAIKIDFDSAAEPDIENYVKVCEAIQALCSLSAPTIQACVEKWHQTQQRHMQPCMATSNCLPNKKPTVKSGACQPCINWTAAVEAVCYPPCTPRRSVEWRNVDATLFHKNPVEVAKCFLFKLPHGQSCKTFDDFDIGGMLKLMMGFKEYHNGDQAIYGQMQKVLDIRNSLSHMRVNDNMCISDKQLGLCFDAIEDLVSSLKTLQPTLQIHCNIADDIKSCLNKIRQSKVTTDMTTRALDPLSDSLIQALDDGMKENRTSIEDLCLQMNDIEQRLTDIEKNQSVESTWL
ncbi:uncharacterized protein [Amphiura filiformis]|uniref:uncharacterized protein n=1 Tax=Amphiura filiformis TaxID=82378 RepID=UPI003B220462